MGDAKQITTLKDLELAEKVLCGLKVSNNFDPYHIAVELRVPIGMVVDGIATALSQVRASIYAMKQLGGTPAQEGG